jgi:hypothetical protein
MAAAGLYDPAADCLMVDQDEAVIEFDLSGLINEERI